MNFKNFNIGDEITVKINSGTNALMDGVIITGVVLEIDEDEVIVVDDAANEYLIFSTDTLIKHKPLNENTND